MLKNDSSKEKSEIICLLIKSGLYLVNNWKGLSYENEI